MLYLEATIFSTFIMFHSHDNLVCRQCYFHFAGGENEVQYVGLRATEHTKIVFRDFFFHLLRAAPRAYRASQARGQIRAVASSLHYSHRNTGSKLPLRPTPTAHSNARSLTHWMRPGIEPTSSWILVRFINHWTMMGTPTFRLLISTSCPILLPSPLADVWSHLFLLFLHNL